MLHGCPKANEAKVIVINKILNSCELCSRFKIKRVCIKCKPGFKNPKALSTEVMPSDKALVLQVGQLSAQRAQGGKGVRSSKDFIS